MNTVPPTVLVTGVESSGTKMVSALLRQGGAKVRHSSPHYRLEQGDELYDGSDFDAVVIVVRSHWPHVNSMVDNGHAANILTAEFMAANGLLAILEAQFSMTNVYIVTYEAIVHEPEALPRLCEVLGLPTNFDHDPIGDSNAKWYGGDFFRDQRDLHERR